MLTQPPDNGELYKRAYKESVWGKKKSTGHMYGNGSKGSIFSWLTPETRLRQLENHYRRGFNVMTQREETAPRVWRDTSEVMSPSLSLAHSSQELRQRLHNQTCMEDAVKVFPVLVWKVP